MYYNQIVSTFARTTVLFEYKKIIGGKQMTASFVPDILGPKTKDFKSILNPNILSPKRTQRSTNDYADYLVAKYHSPEFRPLFLRAVWHLEKQVIDRIVEASFSSASNPRAYFISSVKSEKAYYENKT